MRKINLWILKICFCLLICYVTNKMSDTYISGGIAGILCMAICEFLEERNKQC